MDSNRKNGISFAEGSDSGEILVENTKPIQLNVKEGAGVNIENIILTPKGDGIERCRVRLDGNFNNTNIEITSSVILDGGNDFEIDAPIRVMNNDPSDTVRFTGNYRNTNKIRIESSVNIEGDEQDIPEGANIEICPEEPSSVINLKGNLSQCNIDIKDSTNIRCNAQINNLIVEENINKVYIFLDSGTVINNIQTSALVEIEGDEEVVKEFLEKSHTSGQGEVRVLGVFKDVLFKNGIGRTSTIFSMPGKYNIIIKIKQGSKILSLNKKLPVTIIYSNQIS